MQDSLALGHYRNFITAFTNKSHHSALPTGTCPGVEWGHQFSIQLENSEHAIKSLPLLAT